MYTTSPAENQPPASAVPVAGLRVPCSGCSVILYWTAPIGSAGLANFVEDSVILDVDSFTPLIWPALTGLAM